MMRKLTLVAALALLSTVNAANLRGADTNDKVAEPQGDKQQWSAWWWAAGPRDIAREPEDAAAGAAEAKPEHRKLPPLSHGWTYEPSGGRGGKQQENTQQQPEGGEKQLFGLGDEQGSHPESPDMPRKDVEAKPEHRVLPPLSHGWAYEGGYGAGSSGRKQVQGTTQQQEDGEPDMPRKNVEPQHRVLPPLSHGWSYEGGAGAGYSGRKQIQGAEQQQDAGEPDMPRKELQQEGGKL